MNLRWIRTNLTKLRWIGISLRWIWLNWDKFEMNLTLIWDEFDQIYAICLLLLLTTATAPLSSYSSTTYVLPGHIYAIEINWDKFDQIYAIWLLLLLACPLFLHNFIIYVLLSTLYTVVILFSPKWPAALLLLACVTTVSLLFAVVLHWIWLPSTTSICSIQPIILYLFSLLLYYLLPIIQGKHWVLLAGYFLFVQVLLCLLSYLSISGCSYCYYCPPLIGQLDHLVSLVLEYMYCI